MTKNEPIEIDASDLEPCFSCVCDVAWAGLMFELISKTLAELEDDNIEGSIATLTDLRDYYAERS